MPEKQTDFQIAKRVAVWDIEATSLEAQHGYMLCSCIKEVREGDFKGPTHTISILDPRNRYGLFNDRWVVEETIRQLNQYDLILTWYGSRYDFPFINTRALHHKLLPPAREFRRDLCFNSRGSLKLKNNRLATVGTFLFGESGKTFLDWGIWIKAQQGDRKSIGYIVDHCQKDVAETEKVYKRFIPLLGKLRKR